MSAGFQRRFGWRPRTFRFGILIATGKRRLFTFPILFVNDQCHRPNRRRPPHILPRDQIELAARTAWIFGPYQSCIFSDESVGNVPTPRFDARTSSDSGTLRRSQSEVPGSPLTEAAPTSYLTLPEEPVSASSKIIYLTQVTRFGRVWVWKDATSRPAPSAS